MPPRVVIFSLASDFGCQVQLTNMEDELLEVLGLIDLGYWQLASSGEVPESYDVAVIEGAVTTDEHVELLARVRKEARRVIAIGACACTGGIAGLAYGLDLEERFASVYGADAPVARGRRLPASVASVIDVDYHVPGCPIDPRDFVDVLSRVLLGLSDKHPDDPMCAICKIKENICLLDKGEPCLGLVTDGGCQARCVSLGMPCKGCRGLSPAANLDAARAIYRAKGLDPALLDRTLDLYNSAREAV